MAVIDKIEKPRIYTESEQILTDLKDELAHLKSRMSTIEQEQEANRNLMEQVSFQEDLANELIANHQEETKSNKENFQVIASVMNGLKTPVSDVVKNLSGVISIIDDGKTRETLQDCMYTASNVLNSFSEVESFCLTAGSDFPINQKTVNNREFFREIVSGLQANSRFSASSFRLLIEKNVPEKHPLCVDNLTNCLHNLINEIHHTVREPAVIIRISVEDSGEKYGIEISDLAIQIEIDEPIDLEWSESWVESIENSQGKLLNSGFNLLTTRDLVRKTGGHLEINKMENKVKGFKFVVPLTY